MTKAELSNGAEDGFTLVETIVAFLVLSIAMVVATQTIKIAADGIKRSTDSDQTIELANAIHLIEVPKLVGTGQTSAENTDQRGHWRIGLHPEDGQPYRPGSFTGFTSIEVSTSVGGRPQSFVFFDSLFQR